MEPIESVEFLNRSHDLSVLKSFLNQKKSQFIVCYGRRRVGKTALLSHFARKNCLLHWTAYRSTADDLLADFSRHLDVYLNRRDQVEEGFSYGTWKLAFETLALHAQTKKLGVIIDEFPYLVEADPSLPSVLQSIWDNTLMKRPVFFALSGSRVGMMEREILSPKGPLYGRATAVLHLKPIAFVELKKFYPSFSPAQMVELYAITGGIPKYFEFIDSAKPIFSSLKKSIESSTTFLTAEPQFLLNEEFRETKIYLAVLKHLGRQSLELKALSSVCGVNAKSLSKYLDDLTGLKMIGRMIPAGIDPLHSRKGRYKIVDAFLNFYFHFIEPFRQDIEKNYFENLIKNIQKNFDAYVGRTAFEALCCDWLRAQANQDKLSFIPESIGSYWDKKCQIDVMGVSHKYQMMILGECKWQNQKMSVEVIQELEKKATGMMDQKDYHRQLIFFSKSGFTPSARDMAKKRHYRLVDLTELVRGL